MEQRELSGELEMCEANLSEFRDLFWNYEIFLLIYFD